MIGMEKWQILQERLLFDREICRGVLSGFDVQFSQDFSSLTLVDSYFDISFKVGTYLLTYHVTGIT